MLKKIAALSILIVLIITNSAITCTIGIANGSATADGRPMLWKTRDATYKDNVVAYYSEFYKYKFVAVSNAHDTYVWQGVNEKGLAIINSLTNDMAQITPYSSDNENGSYMRKALGYCATVDEFEQLLKETNSIHRETMANFAVIDAAGNAAIFETANNKYWKFDTKDTPNGYIIRTNFAFNGDGKKGLKKGLYSLDRYNRSSKLIADLYADGKLTYKDILRIQMRDFSDKNSNPIEIPSVSANSKSPYVNAKYSICRSFSVSESVIVGVLPNEDPNLSTMWTILGHPATTVAVPYWPVGKTPKEAFVKNLTTAPLCDTSLKIKGILFKDKYNINTLMLKDRNGNGLLKDLFKAEDNIFAQTENKLAKWRKKGVNKDQMLKTENKLAEYAQKTIDELYQKLIKE